MRVSIVFVGNCFGGSVRVARFIGDSLESAGYSVSYLAPWKHEEEGGVFDDKEYKIIPHRKKSILKSICFLQNVLAYKKALASTKPDLVITTIDGSNYLSVYATKLLGKKVVVSEHQNHANMTYNQIWKPLQRKKRLFNRYICYKMADFITFLTRYDYDFFTYIRPKKKLIMKNPMTLDSSLNSDIKKENIILFPSRLDENKRPMFLLGALARIDTSGWRVVFLGDGKEQESCIKFARENGIKAEFLGFSSDIKSWYEKAKIVALTSKSEGLPNILVEAIFYDCARIATDCITGPSELIEDGIDGFLCGVDDEAQFARKLESLLKNDNLISDFARNARLRRLDFDPKTIAKKWVDLVQKVAKKQ